MIVFVNQMLLMRAGDVERNPGPGECSHMQHLTHALYTICVEQTRSYMYVDSLVGSYMNLICYLLCRYSD